MQYNSSIAQTFMVMSFVSAGLLLSIQFWGDKRVSPSTQPTQARTISPQLPTQSAVEPTVAQLLPTAWVPSLNTQNPNYPQNPNDTQNPTYEDGQPYDRANPKMKLVVDLSDRQLLFHGAEQQIRKYPIAVGKAGWETPLGEFTVMEKDPSPLWKHPLTGELVPAGTKSPLGSRWIGFWSDGIHQIGFHGTHQTQSIGQAVSHGCIRLRDTDIQELYAQVELGTLVIIKP